MVGVLQSVYDRRTGECLSREIVEIVDMTDEEYYAPLVKILSKDLLNKSAEQQNKEHKVM